MTAWLRGSPEALRSLITRMKDIHWSEQMDDAEGLCQQMGWTLLEVLKSGAAYADAGLNLGGDDVRMKFRNGHAEYVTVQVTQTVRESGTDRDRFIRDVFADAVDEGVAVLGEPTDRQHTEPPTVRWRLPDSTVLVSNLESAVTVTWASNKYQDEWDRVAEALA